jgi:tRNA threonylcarbamoyladenosine biosynthesis protein TsaE
MRITAKSAEETIAAGREFAAGLPENAVVLMYGDMGAGKTHFVKGMAQSLGIADTVTSPTFALVNDYGALKHFDLFRICSEDDLYAIGFYDYIGQGILAAEWAENVPELAEFEGDYEVRIAKIDENTREIAINEITRT